MRILAVDPGEKNLGIAISDPTAMLAAPLTILRHISRPIDAAAIIQLAEEHGAGRIIVGQALDEENSATPQSRSATRLAFAIKLQTRIPVILWDESGTTQAAQQIQRELGVSRKRRRQGGHLDDLAAAALLQNYLDAHPEMHAGDPVNSS